MQNSERSLLRGAEILGPTLDPLGYSFEIIERGPDGGCHFTIGRYRNGDREIKLLFRNQLGGVTYWKRDVKCSHILYMQALGREHTAIYPAFGNSDETAEFRCLLQDFQHCDGFLTDDGHAFYRLMKDYKY